jgi:hypothetical protein
MKLEKPSAEQIESSTKLERPSAEEAFSSGGEKLCPPE